MALRYRAYRRAGQGRQHGPVRPLGDRHRDLARGARHAAERRHHGRGRLAAFAANAASFALLWAYRAGDANMRSAWICTRNDAAGNLAVLLAAAGVFGTGTGWPDLIVAAIMAGLALAGLLAGAAAGAGRVAPAGSAAAHR